MTGMSFVRQQDVVRRKAEANWDDKPAGHPRSNSEINPFFRHTCTERSATVPLPPDSILLAFYARQDSFAMSRLLSQAWHGYLALVGKVNWGVSTALGKQGRLVSRRPVAVLITITVLVAACCAGWARIHTQSKSDKLWCASPSDRPTEVQLPHKTQSCNSSLTRRSEGAAECLRAMRSRKHA